MDAGEAQSDGAANRGPIGLALAALVLAIATGRLPRWVRIVLVLGLVGLAIGSAFYGYRYTTQPSTLTVAAGSSDGAAVKLMSMIATELASNNAPIRLNVLDKGTALEAIKSFSSGQVDLAVARADIGDLSSAQTVVVIARSVVLLIAPPGSSVSDVDDLKGKTVGVLDGDVNRGVVAALTRQYDLESARTRFENLKLTDVPQAVKSRRISALLVVIPIADKYIATLRNLFSTGSKSKPALIPIESAGAIAAVDKYYHAYELPKGTLQGSPPIPDEDMKTLQVTFYLVATKKLSDDVVASLAKSIMNARRDLIGAFPFIAQISEPDTDKSDDNNDTYIPVHPGAAAYFGGNVQSFFDKHGDQIFYGSMLLGTLASLFAGTWKFMTRREAKPGNHPLLSLQALIDQIGKAATESDLADTERRIDKILKGELERYATGNADPGETAALGLATHRLEHLIAERRSTLKGGQPKI
jgi:TRAP transporter TAXI family solute receptor